jgi:hypothetical protein
MTRPVHVVMSGVRDVKDAPMRKEYAMFEQAIELPQTLRRGNLARRVHFEPSWAITYPRTLTETAGGMKAKRLRKGWRYR